MNYLSNLSVPILSDESMDRMIQAIIGFDLNPDTIGSLISSGIIILVIIILSIIVNIKARHADPLKKPKGLLFAFESGITFFDNFVEDTMGKSFKGFGGFLFVMSVYVFLAFIIGLTGLPSPMTNLAVPLSLGFITFVLIHATSIRFTKWKYFKRYVEPFAVFLPINLLSMWAPLLSLTLRLFGNALAGFTLMNMLYFVLEKLSELIFSFIQTPGLGKIWIAPFIAPIFHAYFDLFSGFIQTTVFIMVSSLYIANEEPDEEEMKEQLSV